MTTDPRRRSNTGLRARALIRPAAVLAVVLTAAGAPGPWPTAAAEPRDGAAPPATPQTAPTRDAAATYRVIGTVLDPGGASGVGDGELRISWLAATGAMRVEAGEGHHMLIDRRTGRTFVVLERDRTVVEMPPGFLPSPSLPALPGQASRLVSEGRDLVAGVECTVWRAEAAAPAAAATRVCVTADGVPLRVSSGGVAAVEATRIDYARQDPARFLPPADFARLTP